MNIQEQLFASKDDAYKNFNAKLIPNIDISRFIGVRTPILRSMANDIVKAGEGDAFMDSLPHEYFEENQIHGFIISKIKDFDTALYRIEQFLPYIDNWATCDQTKCNALLKNTDKLYSRVKEWCRSGKTYYMRFGLDMLMSYFLDELFFDEVLETAAEVHSDEYYVQMMQAWFFATALAKHEKKTLPYIEGKRLTDFVHNKTIQKARESNRISCDMKEYLRTLKV